jgi:GNAT superfamily N-acetyltransferase
MTHSRGPQFRAMTEDDLGAGLRLSRACGWNQTLEDWRRLLALGPGLFRVGVEDGRVVAAAGAVRYEALAWICMVLVDPAERGRGLGTAVFDEVLGRCQAEVRAGRLRTVGLDATPGGRRIYLQRGFVDGPSLVRLRVEPPVTQAGAPKSVGPLAEEDVDTVLALDREVFGADRAPLLRWARGAALELAWVARVEGRVTGYCFGRHGDRSDQVGPVVAEGVASAVELVRACLSAERSRSLLLDARVEPSWLRALDELGFREERPFARMYLGAAQPPARPQMERAVFGPEFG